MYILSVKSVRKAESLTSGGASIRQVDCFRIASHPPTINSGLPSCPFNGHNVRFRHPLPQRL